jgi:glycosyltransferase involved in cell wall biosynthesis
MSAMSLTTIRILHVPYTWYPDPCGGTEVYVASLIRGLEGLGFDNAVAAPATQVSAPSAPGLRVHRFVSDPRPTQDMLYGAGDRIAAEGFANILDREQPDLVHFHAFSPAVSRLCLEACQRRGIATLSTFHTPAVSCPKGDLMRWGTTPCDGKLRVSRCAACVLHQHGVSQPLSFLALGLSRVMGWTRHLAWLPTRLRTFFGLHRLVQLRRDATLTWWSGMQRVVAVCEWGCKLLKLNGLDPARVVKVRHGLPDQTESVGNKSAIVRDPSDTTLRLVFLGRLDPTKGIDLIVEAMAKLPDLPLQLDLYALPDSASSERLQQLRNSIEADARIQLHAPRPSHEVVQLLGHYDVLLVPSRWMETGPLVVLEAFAAGIPVVGSNLGGIAEWVISGQNGLLVEAAMPEAWASALAKLHAERDLIPQWRSQIQTPRRMSVVAAEMAAIYREVLEEA